MSDSWDDDDYLDDGEHCEECGRYMYEDEDDGFGVCPDCCATSFLNDE